MSNERIAERIADSAQEAGARIAVAESLTSGAIASALGAAPGAADWFGGGIVAYGSDIKHDLLRVAPGPVVCASAAEEMSRAVREMFKATIAVAVTGAGGPAGQDDRPAGTVFIAVASGSGVATSEFHFDGDPEQVVEQTVGHALRLLEGALAA